MEMNAKNTSPYTVPQQWIRYYKAVILDRLVAAKTEAGVLRQMPYLPQWIEEVHEEQLRLEAAGTSRIEGAEFSEREQAEALVPDAPVLHLTHSQRQLRAAESTYRWLRSQPADRPVNAEFILEIHRRIVTGCDDARCEPGALRRATWDVRFGTPRCRGVEGGDACRAAFDALCRAIAGAFRQHDGIVQAMATHYHIGAMHPFGDGNGRTARAVEAFMMRRANVNDLVMVSLSTYYYDHKDAYLAALYESRQRGHDLTPFLMFALPAVAERCSAVAAKIVVNHKRALFREFARSLFGQLRSPRRRVIAERQLHLLEGLLTGGPMGLSDLLHRTEVHYRSLKFPERALIRDVIGLIDLKAIAVEDKQIQVNLAWPQKFSESELLERYENMPAAVSARHPAMARLSQLLSRR